MNRIDFTKLVGREGRLYYNNQLNCFQLGTILFEALEDEQDGYRSCLKDVVITIGVENKDRDYLSNVIIKSINTGYYEGYELVDINDNHVWLDFGTNHNDDYYPIFTFSFHPKTPTPILEQMIRLPELAITY